MIAVLRFLFVIPIGFAAGCFGAAAALLWPYLDLSSAVFDDPILLFELSVGYVFQTIQVGTAAFLPFAAFAVVTEWLRLDRLLVHALCGLAGGLGATRGVSASPTDLPASLLTAFAVAGLTFGLIYWVVAGRSAGHWHRPATIPPIPSDRIANS